MNKIDWNEAPVWADAVRKTVVGDFFWCNDEQYLVVGYSRESNPISIGSKNQAGVLRHYTLDDLELVEMRPNPWKEGEERMRNIGPNGNNCEHYEEVSSSVDGTLKERGTRYGEFSDVANTTQLIKSIIGSGKNAAKMNGSQCEALDMIASKIARIVNGDPDYIDNWHDIAGYARLVEKELEQK